MSGLHPPADLAGSLPQAKGMIMTAVRCPGDAACCSPGTARDTAQMLLAKIKRTIARYRMLAPGDGVVVAVSGGPDSVCLLSVLQELAQELSLSLHIAHLDHGFRGAQSAGEARFVEELARTLDLPATIEKADVPRYCAEHGLSAQAGAREVRYRFLERVARDTGCCRIALGHTASDQAETVLMRLIRGAGLAGLSGIRPMRESIIRPLIDATRDEVIGRLREKGLAYATDPSNLTPAYTRNRVRAEILPVLERFNPSIVDTLAAAADLFREEDEAQEAAIGAVLSAVVQTQGSVVRIDRDAFLGLPAAHQKRVLRRSVEGSGRNGPDLSAVQTEEALAFMRTAGSGRCLDLPCGLSLEREYGSFVLQPRKTAFAVDLPLAVPGVAAVPEFSLEVETTVTGALPEDPGPGNYLWQAVFDYDKITLPLHLRNRRPGDVFQPAGMGGHRKKLQDFLVDSKVPRLLRDRVPVLATASDIVWVLGMRTDGRFLPGPATRRVVIVTARRIP